jgi:hypothetical protein
MFGWFFRNKEVKNEVERVEEETRRGFIKVRDDLSNVSKWIKHLDKEERISKNEISEIKGILSSMQVEIEGVKNMISLIGSGGNKRMFKTNKQVFEKQTAVVPVQVGVQTAVQTPNFDEFSISEKSLIWILINSDMKLSYEDLAAMTGKEKATIRGQINSIKQKCEYLIEELVEKSGKKRVYIPEELKARLIKKAKVEVVKRGRKKKEK